MTELWHYLTQPFVEFDFMRMALASIAFLALSCAPVGVFLMMRRMSLMGDAMSHAVLPGAAAGYMLAGLSLPAMSVGGFAAGLLMALGAGIVSRFTELKEDANFAAFYLSALALGVVMVSRHGSQVDLLSLLFGSVLSVNAQSLALIAVAATVTLFGMAILYRPLIIESIDPLFLRAVNGRGGLWYVLFLMLVVINLVAGFQTLGTLMSVGLMMLPAISARLWTRRLGAMLVTAVFIAFAAGVCGLLLSYYVELPSGPAIILVCGAVYAFSVLFAPHGGLIRRAPSGKHHRI